MKIIKHLLLLFILFLLGVSCEPEDKDQDTIEGTYIGTLSVEDASRKSYTTTIEAVAQIEKIGVQELEIHCYSEKLDTIFRLNYFEYEDKFKVCLTGQDFENTYHAPYTRPMGNSMMHNSGSQWMQHLNSMHQEGDVHYGEFNTDTQAFEYYFFMDEGSSSPQMHFRGTRQKN